MIRATAEFWHPDAARCGPDGRVGRCTRGIRRRGKTGRHRSAFEPLVYLARVCLQRVDGFALFRFNCAMRDCRQAGTSLEQLLGHSR